MSHRNYPGCPLTNSPYGHCSCAEIDLHEHTEALNRNSQVSTDRLAELESDLGEKLAAIAKLEKALTACLLDSHEGMMDKRRLDWLQEHGITEGRSINMPRYSYRVADWRSTAGPDVRGAIDIAMEETANEEPDHEHIHRMDEQNPS